MKALIAGFVVCVMLTSVSQTQAADKEPQADERLYVPESKATRWLEDHKVGDFEESLGRNLTRADIAAIAFIASQPQAVWINSPEDVEVVKRVMADAKRLRKLPQFAIYLIPGRDNGNYSAGGVHSVAEYSGVIAKIADAIGKDRALIFLEPDAIGLASKLEPKKRRERMMMLSFAVKRLKQQPTKVYLDVSYWMKIDDAAESLVEANIAEADGFVVNVSNYQFTKDCIDFGTKVSAKVGHKHFVIDTSRNGQGPWKQDGEKDLWCNPPGRGLGTLPTANTGNLLIDAYLWVKCPGESDGECRSGPRAGDFWPAKAIELYQNRGK
jgi:endoglucanase